MGHDEKAMDDLGGGGIERNIVGMYWYAVSPMIADI